MNANLDPTPGEESTLLVFRSAQRKSPLDVQRIQVFVEALLRRQSVTAELGFHFVGAREMTRVNWQFLGHHGSTDIITFDYGSSKKHLHGECFISVVDAVLQAEEFGSPWTEELARYLIHGILHLQGHDDLEPAARRRMKAEENRLVLWARRSFDLSAFHRKGRRQRPDRR